MNLIIDVGNTRIKIAVFNNGKMIHNESVTFNNFYENTIKVIKKRSCTNAIISSVGSIEKSELVKLSKKINLLELNFETKTPFKNKYLTPKTLGVDRIALVSAAILNYPNKNVLIIDAGTCITYDFINSDGYYLGGSISPGLNIRYKSLNHYTNKLPLLEQNQTNNIIGNSTETCIHSGINNGVIFEINGFIDEYRKKNEDLTVVLTGGDVNFLANRLKNSIFANPNFLLEGLNKILTYNLK